MSNEIIIRNGMLVMRRTSQKGGPARSRESRGVHSHLGEVPGTFDASQRRRSSRVQGGTENEPVDTYQENFCFHIAS
jgi:hypothetical protein